MQGTNTFPIDRENDGAISAQHEFYSNAIGLFFAKAFHRTCLMIVRLSCRLASSVLLALGSLETQLKASLVPSRSIQISRNNATPAAERLLAKSSKLIVIGFMGGNVKPNNFVHREAKLTHELQSGYSPSIHAEIFANRHGQQAFESVMRQLAPTGALLTEAEKRSARIVIFGHSWGASETVALAKRLNRVGIPVLLTIQVDSVQKQSQNDAQIPPNVREAINFYQADGMLRGRDKIVAENPDKTAILGNFESSYRENPISVAEFPWYARAFMKPHVQIENDPTVWNRIESLILAQIR